MPHSTMPTPRTMPDGGRRTGPVRPRSSVARAGRAEVRSHRSTSRRMPKIVKSSMAWKIGTGQPLARLAGVVHPEPLVGRVTAPGHHQLGAEEPAHAPAGHEHRGHQVGEAHTGKLGAAAPGADDGHRHGEEEPAERRQPTLPDGEDLARVRRVEGEVGEHVEGPGTDDGGDDDPHEHAGHPLPGVAGPSEPTLGVAESEPEGQGQPDPVGVDLEEPDVERDGNRSHGEGGLVVEECPIRDAIGTSPVCPRRPVGWHRDRPADRVPVVGQRVHRRRCRTERAYRTANGGPAVGYGGYQRCLRSPAREMGECMRELAGRVAVVTGGGSGIGLATAIRLADAGVSVAVVDLDGATAERTASTIGGLGLQADVGRSDQWPGIVDAVTARFGGIDLAHLNAGVMTGEADITALTDEAYRRIMSVNVDGVVYGARALVPALAARGGGAIVATASLAGLIGFSPDPIYCLTKHADGGAGPFAGAAAGRTPHHHQCRVPEHRGHPHGRGEPRHARVQRLPAHRPSRRCPPRSSTAWPARRPARPWSSRPDGTPWPTGSPGLPVRGRAGRWARCRQPRFAAHDQG